MKYTIFFFVALLAIASYQVIAEMDEESFNAMFKNLSKECKKKENATDEDIDVIISKETPTTKPGQCIFVCLMTQYGMVVMKDETTAEFSVEGFLKFAKMVHKDDKEKYELSKEMAEECKSTTDPDPDRCDFGLKIIKCLDNAALAGNVTEDM